ncbi:hypothetical protein PCC7418_2127 [Halothece sp. PCC 7418]|uniref:DUF3181 family protein n=1 Tax=Halothece sp. (strain PCC 7418) TaxID=65093 RepID=UPI0002A08BC4|nr:DUF3181 family protein [Halothece sp. PCC 7418]AFZ44288.1 hypothetical protein PCC7418_2127 [Halothece sp. PCC 7418]
MANSNPTREIEALAAEIGDKIYIDVAKWHLYLSDAHLHTTVAEQVYPLLENKSLSAEQVEDILKRISVKLGGGRTQLPLLDLLPPNAMDDLMALLEEYQKQL